MYSVLMFKLQTQLIKIYGTNRIEILRMTIFVKLSPEQYSRKTNFKSREWIFRGRKFRKRFQTLQVSSVSYVVWILWYEPFLSLQLRGT